MAKKLENTTHIIETAINLTVSKHIEMNSKFKDHA